MATKGFNPFLSETDLVIAPAEPPSNPFLHDFPACPEQPTGGGDNPFFNPFNATAAPSAAAFVFTESNFNASGGNPFASYTDTSEQSGNAFADVDGPKAMNVWNSLSHSGQPVIEDVVNVNGREGEQPFFDTGFSKDELADPVRQPSVPQTTKDLLDSVTGALEATSESLMDRLRLAQPSPVNLAPSPSPSPRSPSPDLMGDEHSPAPPSTNPSLPLHQLNNIIDLFDDQTSTGPKTTMDILGLYSMGSAQPSTNLYPVAASDLSGVDVSAEVAAAADIPASETVLCEFVTPTQQVPDTHVPDLDFHSPVMNLEPENPKNELSFEPAETTTVPAVISCVTPITDQSKSEPVVATAKTTPPARPKPPPVPPSRSPVIESKHLPGRPPPPLPPAPKLPQPPPPSEITVVGTKPEVPPVPEPPIIRIPVQAVAPTPILSNVVVSPPTSLNKQHKSNDEGKADVSLCSYSSPERTSDVIDSSLPEVSTNEIIPTAFDDFDAKFNKLCDDGDASDNAFGFAAPSALLNTDDAWGSCAETLEESSWSGSGFGADAGFDSFLQLSEPPPAPQSTPAKIKGDDKEDDEKEQDLSIYIRPKLESEMNFGLAPALAPPPKSPAISTNSAYSEESGSNAAFVPFLSSGRDSSYDAAAETTQLNRTDSQETPQTPLFEEDTSQPLEDFPRTKVEVEGWDMHMRHPNKKKITGQRFWKKVYVRIVVQNDIPIVHIFNNKGDKDPFQEIPLQSCYSISDIGAQQFDQYGKIFTVKIQYVFYKERPGIRPGQISKAGRISDKLTQFAAYAIQGDYQGVKEFGSDLKKLGLPLEHAPQLSQLVKLGTQTYEEMKQFSMCIEEALFRLNVHRDRAIQYKTEEVQVTLVDEVYAEQDVYGVVTKQIARVRLFFLSFLSGVAEVEMGLNDLRRQGKEVVGRHDIIPIATEEWIRTEAIEFSNCVQLDEYETTQTIKFKPPDASYIELLRFRVRPPRHRELPLQVKTVFTTTGSRVEIRSDILVPGFTSRKLGQIPCDDVMVRFPIPECWIYMFRVEKHFRYGSVKSAHRRSGKVKGIERFLGAVEAVENSLMEVTSGQAKYEHQHKSIVWRISRLPKEGQGAYTTHSFFCHITMQAHEKLPENLSKYCYVEFTMPHTTVSHTVCRSIAVPTCDEPPEKCVKYLSRHEYMVEIEHTEGFAPATYSLAASVKESVPPPEEKVPVDPTDSWFPPEKTQEDSDFSD